MKKILLLSSLLAIVFLGCKKSTDNNNSSCTLSESSLVGSYKVTAIILTMAGTSIDMTNNDSFNPLCERDNVITFGTNGNYNVSEGANECNPSGAETGTWVLNGNILMMNGIDDVNINEFTCTSFKTSYTDATSGETVTYTLTRQ